MNQVGRNVLWRLLNLIITTEPIIIPYSALINYCHLQSALHWPFLAQGPSKAMWEMVFSIFYTTFKWSEADDKRVLWKCRNVTASCTDRCKERRRCGTVDLYCTLITIYTSWQERAGFTLLRWSCVLACACDSVFVWNLLLKARLIILLWVFGQWLIILLERFLFCVF